MTHPLPSPPHSDPPGADPPGRPKWRSVAPKVAGAVGTILLTAAVGFAGGWFASNHSHELDLQDATRTMRQKVYPAFAQAANEYEIATKATYAEITACPKKPEATEGACFYKAFTSSQFLAPRSDFQGALNDVYTYGSNRAWTLASRLASTLPASLGNFDPTSVASYQFNDAEFTSYYMQFVQVECRELPPQPRSGC